MCSYLIGLKPEPSKYQYKNQNLPHLLFLITLSEFSIPSNPSFVSVQKLVRVSLAEMNEPKYGYPYAAQGQGGYYQGPPVMAPPQYAAPPPRREPGFLEGCLAALCCCCLIDECCCDPSVLFFF
ncbi:hypothetical protein PRUPE_6G209900 [Prunus persica]|uniref:PREDICTED: cysteine-rich and transmembrane domain-containing A n=4 Tax=Prunus TaxID=3754 RepID=A0A5E4FIR5_PRUDU|nr:uncharacterized protein LOC18773432 [Prunus persica]ONI02605.1 hypothetical protein PRUPE_6G209900 [Prunus persica]VVA27050.1 PREDICTED: cysteine-rich and transmembrane domain-containing A [Prunus dulcis]